LPEKFDDLLKEFKKKKRYNLRAMVRKFNDAGGQLVISRNKGSHKFFLEALYSLHRKRTKERAIVSSIEYPRIKMLHRRLVEESEKIWFYGLKLNNELIAVIYGFEFDNRFFYYQIAHDPDYGELSPGSVLLFLVIEDCCSRGCSEFNFLQGNESYKEIWTKDSRILYQCVFNRGTWRSRLFDAIDQLNNVRKIVLGWMVRGN
jgi:CelD/BcsL family acetyltransferase involved in cellulose biosynthesis